MKNALILAALCLLVVKTPDVQAHPMGNFAVSRYSELHISPDGLSITYRIDFAEIPTFQEMQSLDANGDKVISDDEKGAYLRTHVPAWVANLQLAVDGKTVPLRVISSHVIQRPGAGDLPTLLVTLECHAEIAPSAVTHQASYQDGNFTGRTGWREIIVNATGAECAIMQSTVSTQDRSSALTAYPVDAMIAPPQVDRAEFQFTLNAPTSATAATPTAISGPSVTAPAGRPSQAGDMLARLVAAPHMSAALVLAALATAFGLGTVHALAPGHGKTVVAAYLIGSRGTSRHALALGAVVTFTHTAGVFLLGIGVLVASRYIVAESVYPWLGFASGMTILAIGAWQLIRRWSGPSPLQDPHDPAAIAAGYGHSHAMPDRITPGSLIALGVSGGMVPCPSALILLLAAIALHRTAFGLALVGVFSLGLATVLIIVGMLMLYARQLVVRVVPAGRAKFFSYMPLVSSIAISIVGLVIALQSLRSVGR